ncbi:hypothetical protein ABZS83_37385, partial [Streptomyces sp. NPDC005426]|uniref:hypothetical protein n=1 Tax=Streptomyces sp. NPDC005426 TaxID=3155344 RepID=UPI0033B779FF
MASSRFPSGSSRPLPVTDPSAFRCWRGPPYTLHIRATARPRPELRPDSFHREIGELMWEYCGMARTEEGLRKALDR